MKLVKRDCNCFFHFVFDNATEANTVTFLLPISDFFTYCTISRGYYKKIAINYKSKRN